MAERAHDVARDHGEKGANALCGSDVGRIEFVEKATYACCNTTNGSFRMPSDGEIDGSSNSKPEMRRFAEIEYQAIRGEVAARFKQGFDSEKNSLIIIAALITTSYSTTISFEPSWIAIAAASAVASHALLQKRRNRVWCTRLGSYSDKIEQFLYCGGEAPEGWEKIYPETSQTGKASIRQKLDNLVGIGRPVANWPVKHAA